MGIKNSIGSQLTAAMKDRDKVRVAALRLMRDSIQKAELKDDAELDDDGVLSVLAKMIKQREESIEAYAKGARDDLVEQEQREIDVIRGFMPEPMSAEEMGALIAQAIEEAEAGGPSDMGKVMKWLKGRYEGRASGKALSQEVKRRLAELTS